MYNDDLAKLRNCIEDFYRVLVVGSSNTDMVVRTDYFPAPGETILGGDFFMNPGGKGANQAVAAVRAGAKVAFIAKVGKDIFGKETREILLKEGIDITGISEDDEHPSGVAQITVDSSGENCIVVASGANMALNVPDIDRHKALLQQSEIILLQLEIPMATVNHVAKIGQEAGKKIILNPAPAQFLSDELYEKLYAITPNESETFLLSKVQIRDETSADKAASFFHSKGVPVVVITMGSRGAYLSSAEFKGLLPAPEVTVVDTTAAGDTFNGALAVGISRGMPLKLAVEFANKGAALSVTRKGAQSSVPRLSEIESFN
ncbi:ribokinase [Cyclobacterium lianum]|uniref:Ribokinase n=1 Tax=Cyclobacterium lianum TaxID=388280 RepID=A0A1M7PDJ6_9BACT|nr:ribokinase [Cyclobacterium lianum]SHN14706.1 ribokinase [Cyclobacterium lianum]